MQLMTRQSGVAGTAMRRPHFLLLYAAMLVAASGNTAVQSVMPAPTMAGAGSSSEPMQRLEIRMDNGTLQYVDTPSRDFSKGMRVTLTEDKLIRRN